MERKTIKQWARACVLGSLLAPGCEHIDHGATTAAAYRLPPQQAPLQTAQVAAPAPQTAAAPPTVLPTRPPYAAPPYTPYTPYAVQTEPIQAAQLPETQIAPAAPAGLSTMGYTQPAAALPPSMPAAPARQEPPAPAPSPYGHAEDYAWLSGQVQYSHLSKAWRLRYASVDEADSWGGSVTLSGEGPLDGNLKDGQFVRVRGRLLNPESRCSAPPYRVDVLQPVDQP